MIGVDTAAGQTTWAVQAGQDPNWEDGFLPGTGKHVAAILWYRPLTTFWVSTATVVQGSDYASILYIGSGQTTTFTIAYGCTYQGGQAICTGTQGGQVFTETDTAQPTPIAVAVGTTAAPGATPGAGPAGSGGMMTSVASSGSAPSNSGSKAPAPTQSSGALSTSSVWSSVIALCSVVIIGFSVMA